MQLPLQNFRKNVHKSLIHMETASPKMRNRHFGVELGWDGSKFFDHANQCIPAKYTLTDNLWVYLQNYAAKHRAAGNGFGNGFGYGLAHKDSVTRTLSARYHKDGSEILVYQGEQKNPRRLTPRECARLMGT